MGERLEVLMRVVVFIISGLILQIWKALIIVFVVVNALWTFITGSRVKDLAMFSEIWNTQKYTFVRYLVFQSNKRPFPFTPLAKSMSPYEKK